MWYMIMCGKASAAALSEPASMDDGARENDEYPRGVHSW